MNAALAPHRVLFDADAPGIALPVCDHYAGNEKLMRKSLALQNERGPVFDITFDCEDGASVADARAQIELAARLVASEDNRHGRIGIRVHDRAHEAFEHDLDALVAIAGSRIAYVTFPKWRDLDDARSCVAALDAARRRHRSTERIPVHGLVETHGALRDVFAIAALPEVECLSFGLMDFVSAHRGAIPDDAMRSPGQFDHPLIRRAKLEIAAACHAHGKVPSHNVTTEFGDPTTAAHDARHAHRSFGYTRMWSIHPSQIEPIVQAMAPNADEVALAAEVLSRAAAAQWGPIALETSAGSRLHDRASYRYYWTLAQRAFNTGVPLDDALARMIEAAQRERVGARGTRP